MRWLREVRKLALAIVWAEVDPHATLASGPSEAR